GPVRRSAGAVTPPVPRPDGRPPPDGRGVGPAVLARDGELTESFMTRPKFIAGNWKMFTSRAQARELAAAVAAAVTPNPQGGVAVCPPFLWLTTVVEATKGSPVTVGAQNCHFEKEGAFTGETSPQMILDAGCKQVIVGHS